MDYRDIKSMVSEEVWERLKEVVDTRECPKCKATTTMLRVCVEDTEEEIVKWRCLNCLGLFSEELKEDLS